MQIKELELENFKSFKHQKFIFNDGITAITGPNGSGKSNVFDALIFVLGNNSSNKLRYKKISDLICRDQKEKYATVRLTFTDGTSIERTVTEEASVFRLNGKRTTQEAIVSFLKELKISSDGHNLVQQGNNKKIIDMTELERKRLLEDIAGVSLFDDQREKSEKNLDFVKQKISQARAILDERKTMLDTLEKEKAVAEEYLKVKELEIV
jgi:chromosome segregation protein